MLSQQSNELCMVIDCNWLTTEFRASFCDDFTFTDDLETDKNGSNVGKCACNPIATHVRNIALWTTLSKSTMLAIEGFEISDGFFHPIVALLFPCDALIEYVIRSESENDFPHVKSFLKSFLLAVKSAYFPTAREHIRCIVVLVAIDAAIVKAQKKVSEFGVVL
jgi:hypothetical protein